MNLRDYILQRGITQEDFALLVNVSRAHLSAVITNNRTCGPKLAYAIQEESEGKIKAKDLITGKALGYTGKAKRAATKYVNKLLPRKQKESGRKRLSLL
tara:strand:+ start:140 stop:436 length:297 start_codon:yes stop_codon:yes gene_type:complete